MRQVAWTLLVCLFGVSAVASEPSLRVGTGRRSITPDPLLPVSGGLGPPRPTTQQRGQLETRVSVWERGDQRIAIVSLDLLGFPAVLGHRVASQVSGIAEDHILFCATHTHSAPDCYAFPDGRGGHTGDLKYIDWVCRQTAAAVSEALDHLQPATLRVGTGRAADRIAYNYYAPALYDPRMSVLQAADRSGRIIVTLVNYAIHPEVLGSDQGILSPDLVRPLTDKIEARVGGMAMFVNGAQGGMVTADNRILDQCADPIHARWQDERSWSQCERIGGLMATEALRIIKDAAPVSSPQLDCRVRHVKLPVASDELWSVVKLSPLNYPHGDDRTVTTRLNLVQLGPARIVTLPGEALPNIGYFLKRKLDSPHAMVFGLTNDAFGYIMTRVDYASFDRYEYISRLSLGEMTGEILMNEALQMMRPDAPEHVTPGR